MCYWHPSSCCYPSSACSVLIFSAVRSSDDIGDMHMLVIVLLELRDAGQLGKRPNNGPGRGAAAAGAPTSSARSTMGRRSSEWTYFQSVSPLAPFALVLQNPAADYAAH
ncbi:hypothetical protein C8F01DRAFT_1075430 [Mycena amicta]|nr:hypothetical protein C8F01DRAFT_1075430 [Mycena amicta]